MISMPTAVQQLSRGLDISQSPPNIISTCCYCVPSLRQYYFGLDQVQSEGEACPYMPYTFPLLKKWRPDTLGVHI